MSTPTDRPPARYYPFAWNHSGYRRGRYVVVAGLSSLERALVDHAGHATPDPDVLQCDREYPDYVAVKAEGAQLHAASAVETAVHAWLLDEARKAYPQLAAVSLPTLDDVARHIQEDVVIVAPERKTTTLAYMHVSIPSGWRPEMVGLGDARSFDVVHEPLGARPLSTLRGEAKIKAIIKAKGERTFRRFTWGLQFDAGLDQHPDRRPKLDGPITGIWLRVERQVAVGFRAPDAMLFLIRPYVIPLEEVRDAGVFDDLSAAIRGMDAEQAKYKLRDRQEDLMTFLGCWQP